MFSIAYPLLFYWFFALTFIISFFPLIMSKDNFKIFKVSICSPFHSGLHSFLWIWTSTNYISIQTKEFTLAFSIREIVRVESLTYFFLWTYLYYISIFLFFSFYTLKTLNIPFHVCLAFTVRDKKCAIILIIIPLDGWISCFLAAQKYFLCFQQFYDYITSCAFFEFILFEVCWPPWICDWIYLIPFGKFLVISSSDIPSVPFSPYTFRAF